MIKKIKFDFKWLVILVILSVTYVNFNQERWIHKNVIANDVICYNAYLPALFYENDLQLIFLNDTTKGNRDHLYYPVRLDDGKIVIKTSMGMAISYLPFWGLAHLYCKLKEVSSDGFSEPYHFAILFSSLFYFVIGLFFLWKILKKYFPNDISILVLFCLTFGTNAFYYLTIAGGMAHPVGFCFIAMFLFYAIKWHETKNLKDIIALAIAVGFLTLVRPINILIVIFFIFYDIKSFDDIKNKLRLFLNYKFQLMFVPIIIVLIFLPQLIYWKYTTGTYFFNSYVGEQFYFGNSHVFKGLFGFRKGWLIYTPIMIFPLIGIFFLRRRLKEYFIAVFLFVVLYIYFVFSWWCWWYGGSYSSRALIDVYPIFSIPFATFIVFVKEQNRFFRRVVYGFLIFFITLNLFKSMQAKYNIIHYDSMTAKRYFKVFFAISNPPDTENYLVAPDYEKAFKGEEE